LRPAPARSDLLASITRDKDRAIELLRHSDWTAPLWNWSHNKTVSFIPRRLANEMSIHRWDAENAGGGAAPIPVDLAHDGVDEFMDIFIGSDWTKFTKGKPFKGEVIKFEQTDGRRSWTIELVKRSARLGSGSGPPAVTVSGTASDLILMIWRRAGTGTVEIEGDRDLLDRFLSYEEPPDDD
jgi:uncharacterized protein (TIGR03083 family)